jgi:hypothetical protein
MVLGTQETMKKTLRKLRVITPPETVSYSLSPAFTSSAVLVIGALNNLPDPQQKFNAVAPLPAIATALEVAPSPIVPLLAIATTPKVAALKAAAPTSKVTALKIAVPTPKVAALKIATPTPKVPTPPKVTTASKVATVTKVAAPPKVAPASKVAIATKVVALQKVTATSKVTTTLKLATAPKVVAAPEIAAIAMTDIKPIPPPTIVTPTYNRIYKLRPPHLYSVEVHGLWGKAFLKQYHHHAASKVNDNHRDVRNWFKNKYDPIVIKLLFDSNLCHDRASMDLLRSFCAQREPELATLVFINERLHIWWKLEDIVSYALEHKHHCQKW